MEYEATHTMPADSRIVFDIAADVSTMHRWLPEQIRVRQIAEDLVEADSLFISVHENREGLLRRAPEQLRLEWGSRGRPDYTGWLQVTDRGAGTSEVVVHLSFLGDQPAASGANRARDATQRMLERSLERLTDEVTRQVTQPAG